MLKNYEITHLCENIKNHFGITGESSKIEEHIIESTDDIEKLNIKLEQCIETHDYKNADQLLKESFAQDKYGAEGMQYEIDKNIEEIYSNPQKRFQLLKSHEGIKFYLEMISFSENFETLNKRNVRNKTTTPDSYERMERHINQGNEKLEELKKFITLYVLMN